MSNTAARSNPGGRNIKCFSKYQKEKERKTKTMERIVSIKVANIYPHPDNPRKDVGDVTELAESIKKNGIMQNLTVIPISALTEEPEKQPDAENIDLRSDFHALIGHRRLAAAKMAGLTEVPCKIVSKISKKEQVGIMLEENMQRNDLTIYEQAQGFQMMLDLGETEDSIAEKTGFSKTTVRHRLNIAKLDQAELRKKEQDSSFQLTLRDLYELEKVEDIKTRNKILKESNSSRDLIWKAQSAVKEAERAKKTKEIIALLKAAGVEKAPKGAEDEQYSGKWEVVKEYDLEKDVPKQLRLPKQDEPVYYLPYWRSVRVIKKANRKDKQLSQADIERKNNEKKKKEIKAKMKEMNARRKEFISNIISGKIDAVKETATVQEEIWGVLVRIGTYVESKNMLWFITGKTYYECESEEREAAINKIKNSSCLHQMLMQLHYAMENNLGDIYDYYGMFEKNRGEVLRKAYAILERYGWSFEGDEEQLLNGTHELYVKKEGEGK